MSSALRNIVWEGQAAITIIALWNKINREIVLRSFRGIQFNPFKRFVTVPGSRV